MADRAPTRSTDLVLARSWHAVVPQRCDMGKHGSSHDMQKIMMAVLTALQEEKERTEERAAEQDAQPS